MNISPPDRRGPAGDGGMPTDPYDRPGQTFPKLPPAMVERISRYGEPASFDGGDYLFEVGDRGVDFFLILDGAVDILESDGRDGHVLIITHEPGEFTGELNHLTGRAVLVCARAARPTRVIRVTRDAFRRMVSAEPDIGEIILRAFILRRVGLIQHAEGGTVVLGSGHSASALRIQSFLTRNGYPHRVIDIDHDASAQQAIESFHLGPGALPVVILSGEQVLEHPTNRALADALGITEELDPDHVYDVAVVGAGPAGLAAAVYAASEGLDTIVIEAVGPGGQAGSSSRIENYLGFPTGISGQALAGRAQVQAQKFGARLVVAKAATSLDCSDFPYRVSLDGTETIAARTIVVATGARYRRLDVPDLARFEGQGVHYAATSLEGRLCVDSEVVVVGGGNSAGQAAIFLSGKASHVHILVRGEGLTDTMSDYLVRRIVESSAITLHPRCEITALIGEECLEAVRWRERGGAETERQVSNLFQMIGAEPNSDWLSGCVALDDKGFVKTGYVHDDRVGVAQHATSIPGVFAVGDVRADSVKRVASSVGEGSVVVHAIHGWLASLAAAR
ncbi:FAD-dependent oxidoreductase [Ancylobacter mangrovi]|uniref:FAD-dependent oxidoreductase n=1 Tax=Ancylobacter mangrovi TaxID=2972472 RepID=UPI0021622991|nr:cyclic nucleotide-binding domain-containing thioredoxin-disulfide reductase [Ancylobacter mangrovi]MCS0503257.1 FAD-dependent oxidoreductase [Ancylobacter mangrovi]